MGGKYPLNKEQDYNCVIASGGSLQPFSVILRAEFTSIRFTRHLGSVFGVYGSKWLQDNGAVI